MNKRIDAISTITPALALALTMAPLATQAALTNTWNATAAPGGNSPITAYDWSSAGNWTDGSGAPNGVNANAKFNTAASSWRFIAQPSGLTLTMLSGSRNTKDVFLGDLRLTAGDNSVAQLGAYSGFHFGGITLAGDGASSGDPCFYRAVIAGPVTTDSTTFGSHGLAALIVTVRDDLWAPSASPVRSSVFASGVSAVTTIGDTLIYCPRSSEAISGNFDTTEGSPFLRTSGDTSALAVGSAVSGAGIPQGAWLKRIFADSGWIELSAPATVTATGTEVSFAAFAPSSTLVFGQLWRNSNADVRTSNFKAMKVRETDDCIVEFGKLGYNQLGKYYWGLSASDTGFFPAEIVVKALHANVATRDGVTNALANVVFSFAPTAPATLTFPALSANVWTLAGANDTATLSVSEGSTVSVGRFADLDGTLVKKGAGTLEIAMGDTDSLGTVSVESGTLRVRAADGLSNIRLGSVVLAAGATLEIPEGLTVGSFTAAPGSVVTGGTLTVEVSAPTEADALPAAGIWKRFDASDASKLETSVSGDTTFVDKWFDKTTGDYMALMSRTGDKYPSGSERPALVADAGSGMPYVDLGAPIWTNASGKASGVYRDLILFDAGGTQYKPGSDEVAPYVKPAIKAAFFVVGSQNGGGPLVSTEGGNFFNYGIAHKGHYDGAPQPIVSAEFATSEAWCEGNYSDSRISAGSTVFRVNGEGIYPMRTYFSGGNDVITIAFPVGLFMKTCGLGWSGSVNRGLSANGLKYGEVVFFTNKLDTAQIGRAEAYLTYKWFHTGMNGCYVADVGDVSIASGATLKTSGGKTVTASSLGGAGSVVCGDSGNGDLALAEGGTIRPAITSGGTLATIGVSGELRLPSAWTLAIDDASAPVSAGTYVVVAASSVSGDISGCNVTFSSGKRQGQVSISGGNIVLKIEGLATTIVVR